MSKHEWRKKEKHFYLPKNRPELVDIPEFKFITLSGKGSPESPIFSECISALYALSYAVKMTPKKMEQKPKGYYDYTVYPLEGVWGLNAEAIKHYEGVLNKEDFVYTLMIRQPDFLDNELFEEILTINKSKKPNRLLNDVRFEQIKEGKCVQMLHLGSFDNEPESFKIMEQFAEEEQVKRVPRNHREIYLSDFRKVLTDKLKTVLRFQVT